MTNTSNLPVEALELGISADRAALRAGRWLGRVGQFSRRHGIAAGVPGRGGVPAAGRRLAPASAPWGLAGGSAGRPRGFDWPGVAPFRHGSGVLRAGEVVEIITPGAGGYGPAPRAMRPRWRATWPKGGSTPGRARAVLPAPHDLAAEADRRRRSLLVWIVASIVFLAIRLVPGDPAELLLSQGGVAPDPAAVAAAARAARPRPAAAGAIRRQSARSCCTAISASRCRTAARSPARSCCACRARWS